MGLNKTEDISASLIEGAANHEHNDSAMKQGLKLGRTALDLLTCSTISETLQRIHDENHKIEVAPLSSRASDHDEAHDVDYADDAEAVDGHLEQAGDAEWEEASGRWKNHAANVVVRLVALNPAKDEEEDDDDDWAEAESRPRQAPRSPRRRL